MTFLRRQALQSDNAFADSRAGRRRAGSPHSDFTWRVPAFSDLCSGAVRRPAPEAHVRPVKASCSFTQALRRCRQLASIIALMRSARR